MPMPNRTFRILLRLVGASGLVRKIVSDLFATGLVGGGVSCFSAHLFAMKVLT